jgi:hypothetical protein
MAMMQAASIAFRLLCLIGKLTLATMALVIVWRELCKRLNCSGNRKPVKG